MGNGSEKSIFIGARTLIKEEVKIIVPTFDVIINRVEDIRREANNRYKVENDKKIKKYNNTIALFGNRGTGKTSTMYTVIKELGENKKNILLETIEPDSIGPEGKLIGCILGLFKGEIDKLQDEIKDKNSKKLSNQIKKDFFEDCRFKENNKLKQAYNEALEYYCYTEKDYKALLTSNYDDKNSYIKKSSYVFNADIEFEKKFDEFIREFINCKKNFNDDGKDSDNKNDGSDEPLIFIFIDDVDLNTSKCQEIIEAILKYASHPNIICFITGDYNTFIEEFTISLLKKEKLQEANLWPSTKIINGKTILQGKQELAREYMKKVFPPAYRHYVNTWDLSIIPQYSFGIEGNENSESLFQLLSKTYHDEPIENIFGYDLKDSSETIYFLPAYNMFDKTSRGLINVYYSLWSLTNNLKRDTSEYFINVKSFIENIIDSSGVLVKYGQEIKTKYILLGVDEKQSKIDFEQLQKLFADKENQENIYKDRISTESKYSIFYLCYYLSHLLPKIKYSKEKRKDISKYAILELVSNPILNGYDISIECSNSIKTYFSNNTYYSEGYGYYNYTYNIYFRGFICEILAESELSFGQKFYKNIVSSKLLGYEVFDREYKVSEETYNSLFIIFYESLYNDYNKDISILMNFYDNEKIKRYMNFLYIKSNEEKELSYVEKIFEEVFEGFKQKADEQVIQMLSDTNKHIFSEIQEDFLSLLKSELRNICIYKYKSIIPTNFTECIKDMLNRYEVEVLSYYENQKKELQHGSKELKRTKKFLELAKAIYKTHENEIKNEENLNSDKENFYTNPNIFDAITKMMVDAYGYELIDIFLQNINSLNIFTQKFSTLDNNRILQFDMSNSIIATKINKFLKSYAGRTVTRAVACKKQIRKYLKMENTRDYIVIEPLHIGDYYVLMRELKDLYFSNARYCRKEAKELIDALNNNVKIKIDNDNIFDTNEKWVMQAYSLFIQKAKLEIIDLSKLEKAKLYLKELLPKAIEQQEAKEKGYLDKLGIEDYDF